VTDPQEFFDLPPPRAGAPPPAADTAARPIRSEAALEAVAPLFGFRSADPVALLERGLDLFLAATGGQRGFLLWLGPEGEPREICRRTMPAGTSFSALLARPEGLLKDVLRGSAARSVTEPALVAEALAGWGEAARGVLGFVCVRFDVGLDDAPACGEPVLPGTDGPPGRRGRLLLYADVTEPGRLLVARALDRAREAGEVLRRAFEHQDLLARLVFDPITGLASRGAFLHGLSRALGGGPAPVSVLLCHVEGLRNAARRLGAAWRDGTRRAIAGVLESVLPAGALAASYGAEEFAVVLPATGAEAAANRAEEVRQAVAAMDGAAGRPGVRVSIGAATSPDGRTEPQDLIRRAEQAAAAARADGGDRWQAWSHAPAGPHARLDPLAGLLTQPSLDPLRLGIFVELARTTGSGKAEDVLSAEVLDRVGEALGAGRVAAFACGAEAPVFVRGRSVHGDDLDANAPFARDLVAEVARHGQAARFSGSDPHATVSSPLSVICAPLVGVDGVAAILYAETVAPGGFSAADLAWTEAVAGLLAARVHTGSRKKAKRKK